VRPELIAEVEFRSWTAEGVVRHVSFRGLREDKRADEVMLESSGITSAQPPTPLIKLTHPDRLYWKDG
jgi:bifunctional non-homologous end joining protein LigD